MNNQNKQHCETSHSQALQCDYHCGTEPTQSDTGWEKEFERRFINIRLKYPDVALNSIKRFIAEQLKLEREKIINEEVAVLSNLLLIGHGGGNWRRLIITLIERLEVKQPKGGEE